MRGIIFASLVVAAMAVGPTMVAQSPAEAASPPTAITTPTPSITVTATPTATATPVTAMFVWADVTVNAAPSSERVTALIGDVECASEVPIRLPDIGGTTAFLTVPSSAERPGCGVPGAIVHFLIGGQPARGTVVWETGAFSRVSLVIGPDWASYYGRYVWPWTPGEPLFMVVAVVDGRDCGAQENPLRGEGPEWGYGLKVLPDELFPGCGRPGAKVQFELRTSDGILARASETAIWQPGAVQELNLTFKRLQVLPTTGAGPSTSHLPPEHVALAFAFAGITFGIVGGRLRRRISGVPPVGRRADGTSAR